MKSEVFLDTNIILYGIDSNLEKSKIAHKLVSGNPCISTQVINEFANVLLRKYKWLPKEVASTINEISERLSIIIVTEKTAIAATTLLEEYYFSWWDSLMVAAALEANCKILYSEDMQHNQVINNVLTIKNPFLKL